MTITQSRRHSSSSTPYTIPIRHQHPGVIASHSQVSTSVPTLSREFVVRRISEGETGRLKEELKCEACGKGYKHISSLAKHLWEHTPEWNVTKKLLISKHQQVQLLEAASILVGMNDKHAPVFEDDRTPPHSFKKNRSFSASQYPPVEFVREGPTSLVGGYLDSPGDAVVKLRSNSIVPDTVEEDGFRSPPPHDDEVVGQMD